MLCEPSLSSLFHELFAAPWPDDDEEFLNEIKKYENSIRRLMSIDNQITHFIQSQPLLDNDQIASIPCAVSVRKVQILASIEPTTQNQILFKFSCSPCNFGSVFSSIIVNTGFKMYEYKSTEKATDCIKNIFENITTQQITIKANWRMPLLRLSQPMGRFMGSPVGIAGEMAAKILAHIDSRNLLTTNEGDVKCDGTLRSITGKDKIMISDINEIINNNSKPIDPFMFQLDLPRSSRAFSLQIPYFPSDEIAEIEPIRIPDPPIKKLLETALDSKKQLLMQEAFEKYPLSFVEDCTAKEAKMADISDVTNSSYFFLQPWVLDSAPDFIKSSEYMKNMYKMSHPPPPPQPQYR